MVAVLATPIALLAPISGGHFNLLASSSATGSTATVRHRTDLYAPKL
jgi:hypothetical protein